MPRYLRPRRLRRKSKRPIVRKRRFGKKKNRVSSMRSRNLISADQYFTKFKYSDVNTRVLSSVSPTTFSTGRIIRGNDIWDPLSTSGAVPVSGFNQVFGPGGSLTGMYQQWIVHASKIVIEIVNNNGNTSLDCSLYPISETQSTATLDGPEQPYVVNRLCGTSAGNNKIVMKSYMTTKKLFAIKDLADELTFRGTSQTSPTTLWDWAIDVLGSSSTTPTYDFCVKRTITYYVEGLKRNIATISSQ